MSRGKAHRRGWLGRFIRRCMRFRPWAIRRTPPRRARAPIDHVIILDGTMSSLEEGLETNAGTLYKLLNEAANGGRLSLYYEAGVQWQSWRSLREVITGRGINRKIRRAYGVLASRYRPGDRIFLFGYSRGAFAARSLAGMIDRVGLLRAEHATPRNIRQLWRHYRNDPHSPAARAFAAAHCHREVTIEMIGVWDTVKSLGLRLPFLWRLSERRHAFHSHHLGHSVRHGYHALALDETRQAFAPVLWEYPEGWPGTVEQMWFRGSHADVGGHLGGFEAARPLANIPLVWMLEKAEGLGLPLPAGWHARFPCDPMAEMLGCWRGWGKIFLLRCRRQPGQDRSERIHPSVHLSVPNRRRAGAPAACAEGGAAERLPWSFLRVSFAGRKDDDTGRRHCRGETGRGGGMAAEGGRGGALAGGLPGKGTGGDPGG